MQRNSHFDIDQYLNLSNSFRWPHSDSEESETTEQVFRYPNSFVDKHTSRSPKKDYYVDALPSMIEDEYVSPQLYRKVSEPAFVHVSRPTLEIELSTEKPNYNGLVGSDHDPALLISKRSSSTFCANSLNKVSDHLKLKRKYDITLKPSDIEAIDKFIAADKTQENFRELCGFTRTKEKEMIETSYGRTHIRQETLSFLFKFLPAEILISSKSSFAGKLKEIESLGILEQLTIYPEVGNCHNIKSRRSS